MTISEIAKKAGVSKAAVSKVLHNSSTSVRVSEGRAQIIRDIAEQIGYVPNAAARSLKSNRTRTIGLYFYDLEGIAAGPLYTTYLLDGIASVIFRKGYRLTLVTHLDEQSAVETLGDGQLDGVIWCRMERDEQAEKILNRSPIPVVAMASPQGMETDQTRFVYCENDAGMGLAVDHLWELGHRDFVFVCEAQERFASDCVDRLAGARQALERHGSSLPDEQVFAWSWFLDEFPEWWATLPKTTAVLCWSERCAADFMKQCAAHGVSVPDRLSVVGFDSTMFCETMEPKLTAVRQPIVEMARHAAQTLIDLIDGDATPTQNFSFSCSLDIRQSTSHPFDQQDPRLTQTPPLIQ